MFGLVIILSPSINEDFYLHTKYIASFDGINARYIPLSLVSIHISSCISYPSPSSFSGNNPIFHELFSPRVPMMYPHEPPTMQWGLTSPNKILDKVIQNYFWIGFCMSIFMALSDIYIFSTNLIPTRSFYDCFVEPLISPISSPVSAPGSTGSTNCLVAPRASTGSLLEMLIPMTLKSWRTRFPYHLW